MNPTRDFKTKMELIKWARRVLIEAMLSGVSFKTLADAAIPARNNQDREQNASKLASFACFGAHLEDAELRAICDYMGDHDFPADKASDEYDAYFASTSPVAQYKSRDYKN